MSPEERLSTGTYRIWIYVPDGEQERLGEMVNAVSAAFQPFKRPGESVAFAFGTYMDGEAEL